MEEPRAVRPAERRVVAGVAAGVAEHLGLPALWVRLGFAVAAWIGFSGVVAYLLLWRFMPLGVPEDGVGKPVTDSERTQALAVAALGLGVGIVVQSSGLGVPAAVAVPVAVAVAGLVIIWRQFDDESWTEWGQGASRWRRSLRSLVGLVLVVVAVSFLMFSERGVGALLDVWIAVVAVLVGLGLVAGPWVSRVLRELAAERRERVRSQERADMAAHLHDSVLQSLALLQKNADDPASVATIARRQERELRDWLYGQEAPSADSLSAAIREIAASVETDHRVRIEVVAVGECGVDDGVRALVQAAREAMVNAAKHSGDDRIDVYVEADAETVRVFVRDRGVGFDPDAVAEDRMGIAASIRGRMRRHGGRADIIASPGSGTEVRLSVPRGSADETVTASPTESTDQEATP